MNLTQICVKKPVLAWMMMAATIVFGLVAASRIGISQYPDVDFPTVSVNVSWPGAAPEVVENDVVMGLEEALVQVEGLKSISSSCRSGGASITLEFDLSRNIELALQDVQAKVSQATRSLPRDLDPPTISKSNPEDQPILMISLAGAVPPRVLADYIQYSLKEKLQTIPGVGEISTMGIQDRMVRVWFDATKLDEKSLTVRDVISALQREHVELPAGRLETRGREVNVRVMGEALDIETLKHDRCSRGRRLAHLHQRCRPRRGRFRRHPPPLPAQRGSRPGNIHQETARFERRRRGPGRAASHE